VTLWAAIAGRDPWTEGTDAQVMYAIANRGVPPVASVCEVPPAIDALISRACALQPSERFESAQAMAEELELAAREPGLLASHRAVAATIEALQGRDLDRRRELVADLLAKRGVRVADAETGAVEQVTELRARPPRARPWLAFAAVAAVGLAAWGASRLLTHREPVPVTSPPPKAEPPTAVPSAEAPAVVDPTPAPSASAAVVPAAPSAEPQRLRVSRPSTTTKGAPRAPDDIRDKNPYARPKR
jgi:hypothetical protein